MNARSVATAMLLLAVLLSAPAAIADHNHGSGKLATATYFFISGQTSLGLGIPNGSSDQSVPIGMGAGMMMRSLGKWSSPPFEVEMDYQSGDVNFSVWVQGSGRFQTGTQLHAYFGVNDQQGSAMVMSDTAPLTGTAVEFKGSGKQPLTVKKGDSLSVWFYAVESGSGGALVYGSSQHPSYVAVGVAPVNITANASRATGNLMRLTGSVEHLLGMNEIASVEARLVGPFYEQDLGTTDPTMHYDMSGMSFGKSAKMTVDPSGEGSANISWKWDYTGARITTGIYYIIVKVVDAQNQSWYGASQPVRLSPASPASLFDGGNPPIIAALAIAAVAGGVAAFLKFSGRLQRKPRSAGGDTGTR